MNVQRRVYFKLEASCAENVKMFLENHKYQPENGQIPGLKTALDQQEIYTNTDCAFDNGQLRRWSNIDWRLELPLMDHHD